MEILVAIFVGILSGYFFYKVYFKGYEEGLKKGLEKSKEEPKDFFKVTKDNKEAFEKYLKWATFTGREKLSDKD